MFSSAKFFRRYCLLIAVLLFRQSAHSQLVADFTFDQAGGCSPLAIHFSNHSSGTSPDAVYTWDFGNGNSSSLINPGAIYTDEKTYSITLTVQDAGKTASKTKEITVYKNPTVDFNSSVIKGCLPLDVRFTANAAAGDGNISTYTWDFGDGSTQQGYGSIQDHTYSVPQAASVSLTVTNNYGCHSTLQKANLLTVIPSLNAAFSADKKVLCLVSDPVQFTNTSTGPGTLSYLWDFGDGNSSTGANPNYAFNKKGTYSVKLTVKSSEGCTSVMQQSDYLNVADYSTGFTGPETICQNNYAGFNSTSTPIPDNSIWEVDGVQMYSYGAISYWCGSPGTHTIKLDNVFGACKQSFSKNLTVKPIPVVVPFHADSDPVCHGPVTYHFKDNTPSAVTWEWDFNHYFDPPQIGSTLPSPDHDYPSDGSYPVWLRVTNADGCSNSITQNVLVSTPYVSIMTTGAAGLNSCEAPITQTFAANTNTTLTAYRWTFGDGTSSTDPSPTHTFTDPGRYTVTLQYTTVEGCQGTVTNTNYISIWQKNTYDFKASAMNVCSGTQISFDAAPDDPNVLYWSWDFGDHSNYIPTSPHTAHTYSGPGIYTVKLYVTGVACSAVITKEQYITVEDLTVKISDLTNTCNDSRAEVTFTQESTNALRLKWDFGDGTQLDTGPDQLTVKHSYKKSGSYPVQLTAANSQCSQTAQTTAHVLLKQKPALTPLSAQVCINEPVAIQIKGLETNPSPYPYAYPYNLQKLIYPDGSVFDGNRLDNWNYDGSQYNGSVYDFKRTEETVQAIVISSFFNCPDTSNYITVRIKGAGGTPGFEVVNNNACYSSPVVFKDESKNTTGVPIQSWLWDFGDGQTAVLNQGGTISHTYNSPGSYYATLKISDAGGCSSSTPNYANNVSVAGPLAAFAPSGTLVPLNSSIYFNNTSNSYGSPGALYSWDFGDQSAVSTEFSPVHTFPVAGTYTITLKATNPLTACSSTASQVLTVKNFNTAFGFTTSYISGSCPPVLVSFQNTSVNYTRVTWEFGDGVTADNLNAPSHVYEKPGKYIVTLHVYAPNGLSADYIDSIFVKSPAASLTVRPLETCIGSPVSLVASANNTTNYIWDYGDGNVGESTAGLSDHQYLSSGIFQTKLMLQNEDGCYARADAGTPVQVRPNPVIGFSPEAPLVCLGTPVSIQASGGKDYYWTPAAGLSSDKISDPLASPSITSQYRLQVTDEFGCVNNRSLTVEVVQPGKIQVNGDTAICAGSPVQLHASGEEIYQWIETTDGLNDTTIPDPVAHPPATLVYEVTGSDRHNCFSDTATVRIRVLPLPQVNAGPDAEIWSGESTRFFGTGSNDIIAWNWQPEKYLNCYDCASPVCTPLTETAYILTVGNQDGCKATDTVFVKIDCAASHVSIPNIFTPNRDGINDLFMVKGISIIKHMVIYGRWGEKVFERSNFIAGDRASCWDGNFKGLEAPSGSYVYFVEMECPAGGLFTRRGSVILVR